MEMALGSLQGGTSKIEIQIDLKQFQVRERKISIFTYSLLKKKEY